MFYTFCKRFSLSSYRYDHFIGLLHVFDGCVGFSTGFSQSGTMSLFSTRASAASASFRPRPSLWPVAPLAQDLGNSSKVCRFSWFCLR